MASSVESLLGAPLDHDLFYAVAGGCLLSQVLLAGLLCVAGKLPLSKGFDVAYELVSGVAFAYLGVEGLRCFQSIPYPTHATLGLDLLFVHPRLLALANFCQAFYVYDLCVALFQAPAMVPHHLMMVVAGGISKRPYAQYIVYFFGGLCEASNVPLRIVNIFRILPDLRADWPGLEKAAMTAFALLFFVLRIGWWMWLSWDLTVSSEKHIAAGALPDAVITARVGSGCLLAFTVMQMYWGYKVARKALRMLQGKGSSRRAGAFDDKGD